MFTTLHDLFFTLQKLLAEFNKNFELIAFMPTAIGRKREDGE